jgi:hypothetical protein
LVLLSLPALALLAYRLYDLTCLRYEFDRNRLLIVTAASTQIVPMSSIERVIDGRSSELEVRPRAWGRVLPFLRPGIWPGYYVGQGVIGGIGLTLFYAVAPVREQLILVTPALAYGISPPDDVEAFEQVFQTSQQIGPSIQVEQHSVPAAFVRWPIWSDRAAQGILLGSIFFCAALFAVLLFRYPHLPNLLGLHYDTLGQVDRIAPRVEVFALPVIGLIILAVNGLLGTVFYRRERMASYLTWGGALVVQVLFLLALWEIVT